MAKKKEFDLMKYLPLAVLAVSFVSAFTMLKAQASDAKDRIKVLELQQTTISKDTTDIKVQQAQVAQKVDLIYDAIKDLKRK